MIGRKRRQRRFVDESLLSAIFAKEEEWRYLQDIVDRSIDPLTEARYKMKFAESVYMFLLKEAKRRKVSALRTR